VSYGFLDAVQIDPSPLLHLKQHKGMTKTHQHKNNTCTRDQNDALMDVSVALKNMREDPRSQRFAR